MCSIYVIEIQRNFYIWSFIAPVAFKLFVGITHIMIMSELTIRVKQSILIYELKDPELMDEGETSMLYQKKFSLETKLKKIRFILTTSIFVSGLMLIIPDRIAAEAASISDNAACTRYHYLETLSQVVGYVFLALFIAFTVSIAKLIMTLRSKFKKVNKAGMENVFSKEFRTLLTILMVFSGSYLIRFLFDVVYLPSIYASNNPCPDILQV